MDAACHLRTFLKPGIVTLNEVNKSRHTASIIHTASIPVLAVMAHRFHIRGQHAALTVGPFTQPNPGPAAALLHTPRF